MKRTFLAAILLLWVCCSVFGQISTDEEPVSFRMNIPTLARSEKAHKIMPLLDMKKLEQEDIKDDENGIPPRFGFSHEVNYNLENSGEWTTLPDGSRMWRLVISCPDALSINLLYDKFWLPDGAKLFIYSNDWKHTIGAFTSVNNTGEENDIQGFATGLVYGDQITLEYYLSGGVMKTGVISIAHVVHGYRFIYLSDNETRDYGDSQSCNININCAQGQDWQNEKNAVAMILVNGDRVCTGSLINTTANDNRPLFLTADHCMEGLDAITDNSPTLSYWSFYWHYESPDCTNAQPAVIRSTSGATLVANNSVSDFALLLLTEDPRNKTGVTPYYLGWDRSGSAGTSGVGIHHPRGDIKKISQTNKIVNNPNQINWAFSTLFPNMHWKVTFFNGLMEGGSSGSPLINNNRQVIGQLQGGDRPPCNTFYTLMYGKLSVSWTGNGATDNRRKLQLWLDPNGTNAATIDGIGEMYLAGPKLVLNAGSTYTLYESNGGTATWTYSSNLQKLSSSNTSITVKSNDSGSGWIQASVGGISTPRYEVCLGKPIITGIIGETDIIYSYQATAPYYAQFDYRANITSFEWKLTSQSTGHSTNWSNGTNYWSYDFRYDGNDNYLLSVRGINANGAGSYYPISITVDFVYPYFAPPSSAYRISQDPASNELTITPDTSVSQLSPLSPLGGAPANYTVYL
ncbi:MAG: serine protease, partial [Tannerellaceae bacterium]|nr:serine protease [Tannerellaceae bacterium]